MLFQEVQYPDWWVFAILGGVGLLLPMLFIYGARVVGQQGRRYAPGVLLTMAALLFLLGVGGFVTLGKMTTEVGEGQVRVWFGWVPSYSRTIPASEITASEPIVYKPMAEYGGWGIRGSADDGVLSQQGNSGAKLTLAEGGTLLIGSQRAEELSKAVAQLKAGQD